jgi:uncharacterized protein (DUF488 family)
MNMYTFGYEGQTIDAFTARLKFNDINTILDVRELPLSRKPGFSKNSFANALNFSGISYSHLPALGCPKVIRDRYKADGDWEAYVNAFSTYLSGQGEAIAEIARIANKTRSCLVCFEADFNRCHRSIVARAAARVGSLSVVHLPAKETIPDTSTRVAA